MDKRHLFRRQSTELDLFLYTKLDGLGGDKFARREPIPGKLPSSLGRLLLD